MPVINILSPHVADLIAAGEVVERPASVVKELMENSIDAGAKNITVEIRGGGMNLIRVTDDGCGMSPEDAGVAFLRHATSKLQDERGLENIATLGFRGEALAAISSVSHIELLTRQADSPAGTRVALSAGDIDEMGPIGCPVGTTMAVRDLFYNTPARLKFMKSDRAEASACSSMALRCALGHPEVSVRLIKDGEEVFFSPGDGQMKSAVYTLLGRENAAGMVECSGESDGIEVSGYVSAPHAGRGNRAMQFFFINGRAFRSLSIQTALEQAYKNTLLTGRFPGCVLYITLSFGKVDVNVHPTKQEVKFTEEKKVFDCVYYAVLAALSAERKTAEINLSPSTKKMVEPKADFFKKMPASEYVSAASRPATKPVTTTVRTSAVYTPAPKAEPIVPAMTLRSEAPVYGTSRIVEKPKIFDAPELKPVPDVKSPEPQPEIEPVQQVIDLPQPTVTETKAPVPDYKIIGEAMNTYIIAESGDCLWLIDKHAAHERMNFDRLMAQDSEVMSQTLLAAIAINVGDEDMELLEENSELLSKAGFEIDPYGVGSVIIRAVPADTDAGDAQAMVEEIFEKLRTGGDIAQRREAMMHTIACKAAIKAGWNTDPKERAIIAEKVLSGEVKYCPHGRPVAVKLTRNELDKQFKRIV